jgi:hypothetical protein
LHNPGEAIGFEGASAPWLLLPLVALGLASYGVYELVIARRGRFYLD